MKSVLVTGGTVRLGKAIADRLRADGWRVLTSSHRADAGADIVADLAEPMGAAKLYVAALQLLGGQPPDALVNNAALYVGDAAAVRAVGLEAPKKLTMMMAGRETGVGAVVNVLDGALGSDRVGIESDRVGLGSDRVGLGSDRVGLESDRVGLGSDRVGLESDRVGLESDRVRLESDRVGIESDRVGLESEASPAASSDAKQFRLDPERPCSDPKRPYCDAKRELRAFTLSSAMMFAASLRVNAVAPGPVLAPTAVREKAGETLLARRPTPDDVAAAVAFLLASESVTGAILPVDAGQHLLTL